MLAAIDQRRQHSAVEADQAVCSTLQAGVRHPAAVAGEVPSSCRGQRATTLVATKWARSMARSRTAWGSHVVRRHVARAGPVELPWIERIYAGLPWSA
jgi:hypothetical protein